MRGDMSEVQARSEPSSRPPVNGRLVVMLSANILSALVFTALSPVLPEIAAYFGGDDGTFLAQMVMSAPGAGVIVGGLLGGFIVMKFGLPATLFVALACFALVGSAPLYLQSGEWLLASRFALGATDAVIQISLMTLISLSFSDEQRARLIGYATAIGYGGAILSVLASGALAETFGWRAPGLLYLYAIPVLVLALFTVRPVPVAAPEARATGGGRLAALRPAWSTYLIIPPLYAVNYMLAIQFAFVLQANGITSPAEKSWIMVAGLVAGIAGAASSGRLLGRLGQRRLFGVMALLLGSGQAIIGLSTHVPGTLAGAAIAGLAGGMVLPTLVNTVISQVPLSVRSTAIGLVYSTAYLGEFLNPVLLDPIRRAIGIHGVFISVGLGVATIGIATFIAARRADSAAARRRPA